MGLLLLLPQREAQTGTILGALFVPRTQEKESQKWFHFWYPFGAIFNAKMASKMETKLLQKLSILGSFFESFFWVALELFPGLLGALLGLLRLSWEASGPQKVWFYYRKTTLFENAAFRVFAALDGRLGLVWPPSGADLVPKWSPKWAPKVGQKAPKK